MRAIGWVTANDAEIHVAIRRWLSPHAGTKSNDAFGSEVLGQGKEDFVEFFLGIGGPRWKLQEVKILELGGHRVSWGSHSLGNHG